MPHVLVAGRIHDDGLAVLRDAPGITFDLVEDVAPETYVPFVDRADALVIRTQPLTQAVIGRAPRLKFVSRHGVGYDSVDLDALTRHGIPFAIAGDVNSRSVAEHTMMLILAVAKRAFPYDAATRTGKWALRNDLSSFELSGKTLLLMGFGRIGRHVCDMARAFDMRVLAFDPFLEPSAIRAAGGEPVGDLGAALSAADVVSLHMPGAQGRALIGADELARMKPSAVLVNTARGGLIDEDALVAALAGGRLGGAGIDVFALEPPAPDHPLFASDRVVLSPHCAGLTRESAIRTAVAACRNVLDFFAGRLDPSLVVNGAALAAGSPA